MIYFDNSATSYPKPYSFYNNIYKAYLEYSFNTGRSSYKEAMKASEMVFETRELIAQLFGFKCENIVFTKNCTEALNFAIKGLVEKGDEFIISSLEHNSVLRVVNRLRESQIADYKIAEYCNDKSEFISNIEKLITEKTKAVICTFASNVFGVRVPVKDIGELCKNRGLYFVLDASQGAGICSIDALRDNIDILCTSGHKSLLGAMGTGILAVKEGIQLNSVSEGGTGSLSLELSQPEALPDRFESGTLNVSGIYLLSKGIEYINRETPQKLLKHEISLLRYLYTELEKTDGVKLYTEMPDTENFVPILSFNFRDYSSEKTAALLAEKDICTRAGYHCSGLAHKTFSTLETGTVRVSVGNFNTKRDCNRFIKVIKNL